jgi:Asp-tRNA(Asn)/Glu-tRNA(Gln) amidotransferase A subunit family amidase
MTNPVYDLKSLNLPRLSGPTLALVTWLVEHPATSWIVAGSLFENSGINKLRSLNIDEPPTFEPRPTTNHEPTSAVPNDPLETIAGVNFASNQLSFTYPTIGDYARAYREGSLNPSMVAERTLAAIEAGNTHQQPLNAIIACQHDDVLTQAHAATQRIEAGKALSVLDGVPVAVKDEIDMVSYRTCDGTSFLGKEPATEDAFSVARLRAAGALLIGKANMHEIGIGVTGFNQHHGTARNPYNLEHHTGGSSSGPAASVAASLSPLALGADGGGSIRIPSALCGVVGLKPTFGRVSEIGAAPTNWTVAHIGPIGATARDAAIGYLTIAGPDPRDPHTVNQPRPTLAGLENQDLSDLVLGVYTPWFQHASADIVQACEKALGYFQGMGAKVREICIPELDPVRVAHMVTITSEMAKGLDEAYTNHRKKFSLEVRYDLALARMFSARDYLQAQRVRTRHIASLEQVFQEVNLIITPSTAVTAPPIRPNALARGESDFNVLTELMRYVLSANFTGHPAISFPVGYDAQGLPIGMQAIGRYWEEHVLLRLAHAHEAFYERRKPQMVFSLI